MEARTHNTQPGEPCAGSAGAPEAQRSPPEARDKTAGRTPQWEEDCQATTEALKKEAGLGHIVGRSKAIEGVRRQIEMLSPYKVNVLIYGETGTGKELAARALHYLSDRAGGPFVPVNCGAIPENLFENELFGHVRGAFTDAGVLQAGLVQEAEGGTLFLDEIGAVTPYNQVKLLRLLQDSEYKRLGDARPHKADVRVVTATNKDLLTLVRQGAFREDLYYRLDVVSLRIPPLRERAEDIPILLDHFVAKYAREYHRPVREVSPRVIQAFLSHSWPGNVRELESRVQQMVVMASGPVIDTAPIALSQRQPAAASGELEHFTTAKKHAVETFERSYLTHLLAEFQGDVARAARRAGKSRTGLWNLIHKYDLTPKAFGS